MKIKLTRDVYVCGKQKKAGDIVEVSEETAIELIGGESAKKVKAEKK